MHDTIQQALQNFASRSAIVRNLAIIGANDVVFVMAAVWLIAIVRQRTRLTLATLARIVVLVALSYLASLILGHIIVDPRPYIVDHTTPLAPVAHDNGFPSDHTLLAAVITASLWWIDRRIMAVCAAGTLLVMLGRMAIGAHHTLDVLGSVAIVVVATLLVQALPLPPAWRGNRPVRV